MTTGETIIGTNKGMARGLGGGRANASNALPDIIDVLGTPNGIVTGTIGSQVAWDGDAGQFYMHESGVDWIKLGSVA